MKESTVRNFPQNNSGAVEAGAPSAEKDFASSLKATAEVPPSSFEFYVWSDEGINLHVDLNSSPPDWTNRFRNDIFVSISENMHRNESRSLRQDLSFLGESSALAKCSFLQNTNSGQVSDHNGHTKSSSNLVSAKDGITELDQQNEHIPLTSDSLTPSSATVKVADNLKEILSTVSAELTVNVADNLKQDQSTVSAEVSYVAPNNFISGAESCAKDASKKVLDSDATITPSIKSLCGSVGNLLSDPGTLECQKLKHDHKFSLECALLDGSYFVNPGVVCPGASLSSSMEPQISEVASCHKYASVSLCENDGSLDLSDPKNTSDMELGGLINSSEINLDTDGNNFLPLTEEWDVGKIVNRRESSECSQFDDPFRKSSLDSDDQESKMEHHKKRRNIDSEVQGSSGRPPTRILRSMKSIAGFVLPRRSMRLISKSS